MFIPQDGGCDSLLSQAFQTEDLLAQGANYDIVVVYGACCPFFTLVVIGTPMISTVDFLAKFTFERQEILLVAMKHCTAHSEVAELHFSVLFLKYYKYVIYSIVRTILY